MVNARQPISIIMSVTEGVLHLSAIEFVKHAAPPDHVEQYHAAIRGEASATVRGDDSSYAASTTGKPWQRIFVRAVCGTVRLGEVSFDPQSLL